MRSRRPLFALLLFGVGCVNEYHPEYHPVSQYTYVQNISYPTGVVENVEVSPKGGPRLASKGSGRTLSSSARRKDGEVSPRAAPGSRVVWTPESVSRTEPTACDDSLEKAGSLPYVVTRLRLSDAMQLKRNHFARFDVHPVTDVESSNSKLSPLDAWGGSRFDVRPDPTNPELALVRFDVWQRPDVRPGTPLVVTTSSRGDDSGGVLVSFGELRGGKSDPRSNEEIAIAHAP
jgi:hypothetical protein